MPRTTIHDRGAPTDDHADRRPPPTPPAPPATAIGGDGLPQPSTVDGRSKLAADESERLLRRPSVAVRDVDLDVPPNAVTAFIGPSGCGKSTILRCFNRMNDLIPGARVEGQRHARRRGHHAPTTSTPVEVRRRVGLVFQRPEPVPDDDLRERRLRAAPPRRQGPGDARRDRRALAPAGGPWDEVKDDYRKKSGLALSGGQQQRLCIARTLATEPEVILMDEPVLGARSDRDPQDRGADARAAQDVHDRHRHPQHAAGVAGQRPDRVLHDGRGPRRLPRRVRADAPDLHQPDASSSPRTTSRAGSAEATGQDRRHAPTRSESRGEDRRCDRPARATADDADGAARPPLRRRRRARRSTARSATSRTTSCAWAPRGGCDPRRHRALVGPRRGPGAATSSAATPIINEVQRDVSRLITVTIATQSPGRARPALPADARPRDLRARADGRPRGLGRQAVLQARPEPPLERYVAPARDGRARRRLVHGVLRALVDVGRGQGARDRGRGRRDRPALPRDLRRGRRADARRPGQRRARDADPLRVALPRADRRPGDEHRRGRRLSS